MIQEDTIYSGTIQIDNHNLYEDEIRSLVMKELEKHNIILETDFQIVYDVLDSEISFSVFLEKQKDDDIHPENEIFKRITKLKEEFYSCDSNDFERREILLLEMENILDTYYRSHDIKTKNDNISSYDSIISISELKSRLAQNIQRYNDIDIEISNLKRELSQKLDSKHGVLSQEDIINIESDYLKKISNLNSESVQCLMHIDLIENVLYIVKEKEKERKTVDYSILDNIQMVVYPEVIHSEGSRKMPLMIKQLVELRLKSKSQPHLIPNNYSGSHERNSTDDEKDPDMLADFIISSEPIDVFSKEEIYVLEDNGDYYVSLDTLKRFNISPETDLSYNDRTYYKISGSDYHIILSNKDNDYSPYDIVVETISLDNNIINDDPISEVILPDAVEKKILDIYQSDDSDDCYILKSVCEDNIIPFNDVVVVDDLEYVLINSNNQKEFKEHFSDYDFVYHTIHIPSLSDSSEEKSAPVSSGEVNHELYHYLASSISKKPEPCNIKVTREFMNELTNGYEFNIICSHGNNVDASNDLFSYLAKELFDTPRGKEVVDRVNSLSEEELAILTGSSDLENTAFQDVIGVRK